MKTIKKLITAAGLLAAVGFANQAAAVSEGVNGQGDLLFTPMYFADEGSGWETKLTVINSNTTESVVAKLVVRSHKYSEELLDVFLYLSPGDMWTGRFVDNAGTIQLTSEDDSIQKPLSTDFASAGDPAVFSLVDAAEADDSSNLGYVEIFEALSSAANAINPPVNADGTVDKPDILSAYSGFAGAVVPADTINSLSGNVMLANSLVGVQMGINMTAFQDYDVSQKLTLAGETVLGTGAATTIDELENVMAKDNIIVPFVHSGTMGTFGVFTFPTKLTDLAALPAIQSRVSNWSQWSLNVPVTVTVRDTEENKLTAVGQNFSPLPEEDVVNLDEEVNLRNMGVDFVGGFATEGWINMDIDDGTGVTPQYAGGPVLPSYFRFEVTAAGLIQADWLNAAHDKTPGVQ